MTGPMAKTNPFRFSTKYQDDETDLLYYGYRYYNASTGRWLSRDPIGEKGGYNAYVFVRNNSLGYVDRLGLYLKSFPGDPNVFFPGTENSWSQPQRDAWFKDFKTRLGPLIDQAANAHCVPRELLSAIIANEMIDYTRREYVAEKLGFGSSVGPAQITAGTVIREGLHTLWPDPYAKPRYTGYFAPYESLKHWPDSTAIREYLLDEKTNIDVAARLLKIYLEKLCSSASNGSMSQSFREDIAQGCSVSDFCCRKGRSCKEMVEYNAPRCLIQAMAAVWNNGPKIATLPDVKKQSPDGWANGLIAGELDEVFAP